MKAKGFQLIIIFIYGCCLGCATISDYSFSSSLTPKLSEPLVDLPVKPEIEEIKISGEIVAKINDGDFVYPTFSPDGKKIAYSKVLVEETKWGKSENSEILVYDLQKHNKSILLNAGQARRFAVYASFVSTLEWLGLDQLRAYISDGDVDSTILTFNTRTRRVIKKEYSGASDEEFDTEEIYPGEMKPVYLSLTKIFPEIPKEIAITAFHLQQAFRIGNRGVVLQFGHVNIDSNIWFFDFKTKKKQLLREVPKGKALSLIGALETSGNILFFVEDNGETIFYDYQNGKVSQHLKTSFRGGFHHIFSSANKTIFLLKQPNYEVKLQSSLWLFDGNKLSRVIDVENLNDVDIDPSGKLIAFCFIAENKERHISVKKLKTDL